MDFQQTLGQQISEHVYTQNRATVRQVISFIVGPLALIAGALAFWIFVENTYGDGEGLFFWGLFLVVVGIAVIVQALKTRARLTQIFEKGITHTHGKKTQVIAFNEVKSITEESNDGWIIGGLVGALIFGGKSLNFTLLDGQVIKIKSAQIYKYSRARECITTAHTNFLIKNLTPETLSRADIIITAKVVMKDGAFTHTTGIRSKVTHLPFSDIVRIDHVKSRYNFIGTDETGAEAELFRVSTSELLNEAVFTHILSILPTKGDSFNYA